MRVVFHPVLGEIPKKKEVTIYFENRQIKAVEGECVAAALLANGIRSFRTTTKRRESRGYFCGIGCCTDCVMIVDGVPNVRTCITPVREDMRVKRQIGLGR